MGVKESLLVEEHGGPLSICVAGANVNDHLLLAATLDAIVVERPAPSVESPQHLCLDKGYDNARSRQVVTERGYIEHIKSIREEKTDELAGKTNPARRWVVERTFSWLLRWRGISHPLGEETRELPGKPQVGKRASLVPKGMERAINTFEIVS